MTTPDTASGTVTILDVCAVTSRGASGGGAETVGVPGWVLHGDDTTTLTVSIPVTTERPGLVAVVHAVGGADRDRAAHLVLRALTRVRAGVWDSDQLGSAFKDAHAIFTDARTTARISAALLAVLANGQLLASGVGEVRIYRAVDGYAGQLTTGATQPDLTAGDHSTWLGGARFEQPGAYAVPGQPGDRVLICTAGLHRTLPLIQITALAEGDARTAAQGLVRAAAAKDPSISITAVLVDLPTPPTPTPTRRVSVRLPRLT